MPARQAPLVRYAAFLRGVMPMNAKMSALKGAFEAAGFADVRTLLGSGNVVFSAPRATASAIERQAEAAMERELGRVFMTIVRSTQALHAILKADPFHTFRLPAEAKRVVTFLRRPSRDQLRLPIELDGARILAVDGREAFTAYLPGARTPVFMTLIEKTFGRDVTTRTWETVRKAAAA